MAILVSSQIQFMHFKGKEREGEKERKRGREKEGEKEKERKRGKEKERSQRHFCPCHQNIVHRNDVGK